jgi:DNA invertase Pin-like site-specific DNA recombinase
VSVAVAWWLKRLHHQGLDTTTPAGRAMFQMMGVFAEFERGEERRHEPTARVRAISL